MSSNYGCSKYGKGVELCLHGGGATRDGRLNIFWIGWFWLRTCIVSRPICKLQSNIYKYNYMFYHFISENTEWEISSILYSKRKKLPFQQPPR